MTEIYQIIDRFGIPDREWQTEPTRKYDLFIEAQGWGTIESGDRLLKGALNHGRKCEDLGTDPHRVLTIIVK